MPLIASNGAVTRTLGGERIDRSHLEARVEHIETRVRDGPTDGNHGLDLSGLAFVDAGPHGGFGGAILVEK